MSLLLRIIMLAFVLNAGCKKDANKSERPGHSSEPVIDQVFISREKIGLAANLKDADGPAADAEQFNLKAADKLNHLAAAFGLGRPERESELAVLVSDSYHGSPLRPNTQIAFQDESVIVRRSGPKGEHLSIELAKGFEADVEKLIDFKITDSKFKITSVGTDTQASTDDIELSDQLQTDVFVQIWGSTDHSTRQINSNWHCVWETYGGDLKLASIEVQSFEEIEGNKEAGFQWSDCTESVIGGTQTFQQQLRFGLDHWLDRLEQTYGIMPSAYQGLAIGDANGDGLDDLFVAQPGGLFAGLPNCLFLQNDDGSVTDASKESRLNWNLETHCGLFVDLDNDGDQDLVVATVLGLVFAENDGHAHFQARTKKLTPDAPPMSLSAADFDNDGRLDIYACCYANRTASQVMGRPIPYHDANNGGRNALYRNQGDWNFRNVTKRAGLDTNNRRFSFSASWEDFDNDGDLDLYVANDYGRNNLFQNENGRFQDVAAELQVEDLSAGMSVSWGDFNRDGWFDLYVSNMWSSAGKRIAYQRDFRSEMDPTIRSQFQRHARGNSLFVNSMADKIGFNDVSVPAGVTMGRWAWSSGFADINNDGWEDLVVANGFITQEDTTDL